MSEFFDNDSAPLDLATGIVTYRGTTYTFGELIDLWEEDQVNEMDRLEALRDVTRDDQNLWGSKDGGRAGTQFKDDWFHKKKGFRRRKGYPRDVYNG